MAPVTYRDCRRAIHLAMALERVRGPLWADKFWTRIERAKDLAEHRVLCNTAEENLPGWPTTNGEYRL